MPSARFFYDAGSGAAMWPADQETARAWGCPVDIGLLPVSASLRADLDELIARYDTSANWDSPLDPGPWREDQCRQFNRETREIINRLHAQLGTAWTITDEFAELHEDPDLDRYLTDPAGFRRL
jgi:hypothetical protein